MPTVFQKPFLDALVLLFGLDAGEGNGGPERVAELHGTEPRMNNKIVLCIVRQ